MSDWELIEVVKPQAIKNPVSNDNEWELIGIDEPQRQQEFSYPRFLGESGAKGAMSVLDLPQTISDLSELIPAQRIEQTANDLGLSRQKFPKINAPKPITQFLEKGRGKASELLKSEKVSSRIKKGLKNRGVDFDSQSPETGFQRILGKGTEFAGSMLGSAGVGTASKLAGAAKLGNFLGAPTASSVLGKGKELLKMTGTGGLAGITGGALHEAGLPEPVSDLTGAFIAPFASNIARGAAQSISNAPQREKNLFSQEARKGAKKDKTAKTVRDYLEKELGGEPGLRTSAREASHYNHPSFEYSPTLAEVTSNPRLKELQRTVAERDEFPRLKERIHKGKEQLQNRFGELEPEISPEKTTQFLENEHNRAMSARESALGEISDIDTDFNVGEKVRKKVYEEGRARVSERAEKTGPLYEKIEKMEEAADSNLARKYIKEKIKNLPKNSKTRKYLEYANGLISRHRTRSELNDLQAYKEAYKLFKGKPDDYTFEISGLGKLTKKELEGKIHELQNPSIAQLENAKQEIGESINEARKSGAYKKAELLRGVQEKLTEALEETPEIKEVSKLYNFLSEPVNKVYEDPLIGKVLKTTKKGKEYKIGPSQVPNTVLAPSMQTSEKADKLLDIIGKDKNTLESIQKYINNDLLANIVDGETGKVSLSKLESWKKAHPFAKKFYPHLNTKLDNVKNAQMLVNNVERVNSRVLDGYYKEAASAALSGRDPDLLFARVIKSKNKYKDFDELMDLINQDKSGAAKEGLKKSFYRYLKNHVKLANDEINVRAFDDFVSQNKPIIEQLVNKDQMKAVNEIRNLAQARYKVRTERLGEGSRTTPLAEQQKNLLNLASEVTTGKLVKSIGKFSGIPGFSTFYDYIKRVGSERRKADFLDMLDRVLSDPEEAKILLSKPLENEKSMKDVIKLIKEKHNKPYLISPILLQKDEEEDK